MTSDGAFGSRWWKIDFHVHTPASSDYGRENASLKETTTPDDILEAAMRKGLDGVVVADHNSGEWIDRLKAANEEFHNRAEKPAWFRRLTIFPGVEITVSGGAARVHVLAVFDSCVNGSTITSLLGACGIHGGFGDAEHTSTKCGIEETIRHIREAGGIPIPAHIDAEKGYLFQAKSVPEGGRVFSDKGRIWVVEAVDGEAFKKSCPSEVGRFLKGLAFVRGSDAHKIDEIGRRSSWVKISEPTKDALSLSFQSPAWSVKNQEEDPNESPDLFLRELTISGMRHCGRPQPCVISFSPHQTSLIGGRGSGKSTVVEGLRMALGWETGIPEERVQENVKKFGEANVLPGACLELLLRRNGEDFRAIWNQDGQEARRRLQRKDGERWEDETGNAKKRFIVSIFSQKQIEELVEKPHGLLGIIDARLDKGRWEEKWRLTESEYLQVREQNRNLARQIGNEGDLRAQLADLESNLRQFEERGDGEVLKRYQKRQIQRSAVEEEGVLTGLEEKTRQLAEEVGVADFPAHLFDKDDPTTVEMVSLHSQLSLELAVIREQLVAVADRMATVRREWGKKLLGSAWWTDVEEVNCRYQALAEEYHAKNSRLDMTVYQGWIAKRNELSKTIGRIETLKKELAESLRRENELYRDFIRQREELCKERNNFIKKALQANRYVKMEVVPFGDTENVEMHYRELLGLEADRYRDAILSEDKQWGLLAEIARWDPTSGDGQGPIALVEQAKHATMMLAQGEEQIGYAWLARRLETVSPQMLDRFLMWFPEDSLRVQYEQPNKPGKFAALEEGSPGQKAAAVLAFLLSQGNEPLIIDQPEDDLDNALIYDLVVRQLHENKSRRQVIVATHNPNIVVNGDSELVHVMQFAGGQVRIACSGGLDNGEIRSSICDIMEGGREAFERRYKRMEAKSV